jgi:hypothetical protein
MFTVQAIGWSVASFKCVQSTPEQQNEMQIGKLEIWKMSQW